MGAVASYITTAQSKAVRLHQLLTNSSQTLKPSVRTALHERRNYTVLLKRCTIDVYTTQPL